MSRVNRKGGPALFDTGGPGYYAGVVLNRPLDQVFTYGVPDGLWDRLQPGQRVRVPLGRGNAPAVGYCVERVTEPPDGVARERVKDIVEILDDPALIDGPMLALTRWMAEYYFCAWGQALDAVVPSGVKKAAGMPLRTVLVVPDEVKQASELPTLPAKQADVLALMIRMNVPLTVDDVCRMAKCGTGPIAALRRAGLIHSAKRRVSKELEPLEAASTGLRAGLDLTARQRDVLAVIRARIASGGFEPFLLHGVTGSGKTEVYLTAIEDVVARGGEAIVLVPEISLTPQTIRRFRRRFERVAVLHSHMTDAERHRHWRAIAAGDVQVVVGARSAVFAPARRLGLIVIDEEHEGSFKQETVPRYHARDVAVKRAQMLGIPVILGSATPSLESWHNVERGRYVRLSLAERVGGRPMPEVGIVDLRHEKPEPGQAPGGLSRPLIVAMEEALSAGGQVMLLLNRRGFHTFIYCAKCGHVCQCAACDVALTYHKGRRKAVCHMCDAEFEPAQTCPGCGRANLHYGGIGTERLERDVKSAFPDRLVRRMDSDTMKGPGSHEKVLEAFKLGQVEILLGTQMIAKGLDFPDVTLVGVVNADTALHLPDFRAAERTFQLVAQVAGRTGRGDRPGKVLVQTFNPDAPAIRYALRHDYEGFVAEEMPRRRDYDLPPFRRLGRLVARGADASRVESYMTSVEAAVRAEMAPEMRLLGPAPAPVAKIRDLHRVHLQIRAASPGAIQALLRSVLPGVVVPTGVELAVDIDPVSLL